MSESKMNESQTQEQEQEQTHLTQETQAPDAHESPASVQSPGALLAARREELGLSPERVAEQLKMTPRRVLDIETDNFAAVDSKAVYRGFVRAYAKVLRMDPEPLVAMIADETVKKVNLTPARNRTLNTFSETHMPFFAKYSMQTKRMAVAIIIVALLICVLLAQKVGWIPSLPKSTSARVESAPAAAPVAPPVAEPEKDKPAASASASTVSTPTETTEKTKQIDLPPVDVSSQVAAAPKTAPAAAPAPAQAVAATADKAENAVQAAPTPNAKNALVLKCREESWVELKRANGTVVASRYIPAGTTARFTIGEPMQLTVGNAPAVEATLRGVRLNIHSAGDSKVVRLNVK